MPDLHGELLMRIGASGRLSPSVTARSPAGAASAGWTGGARLAMRRFPVRRACERKHGRGSHCTDARARRGHSTSALKIACSANDDGRHILCLGNVKGVATRDLSDGGASLFGHRALRSNRNHPILRGYDIPAGFALPSRLRDFAIERLDSPRDLRVRHESGRSRIKVGSERRRELVAIQEEEPVLRREDRRDRCARGGFLIRADTDSPLSGANAATYTSPMTFGEFPASVITTPP